MIIRKPTEEEFKEVVKAAKGMKLDISNLNRDSFICAFSEYGLAGFVRVNVKADLNELATLGVLKLYRKQGVGTLLIQFAQANYSNLHLVTVIPEFFLKTGFNRLENVPKGLVEKFDNAAYWHGYGDPVVMNWVK